MVRVPRRPAFAFAAVCLAVALGSTAVLAPAADGKKEGKADKPQYDIKEVMKQGHKGDVALYTVSPEDYPALAAAAPHLAAEHHQFEFGLDRLLDGPAGA